MKMHIYDSLYYYVAQQIDDKIGQPAYFTLWGKYGGNNVLKISNSKSQMLVCYDRRIMCINSTSCTF